jgi:hypothetical protein
MQTDLVAALVADRHVDHIALRRIAALAAGGLLAGRAASSGAAPKENKPTKCYGGGSHCTNGKQCCSGVCTNRQCAGDGTVCTPPTCQALGYTCGSHPDGCGNILQCGECISDACTTRTCVSGQCSATPVICDDGDPCTIDSCDPDSGCVTTPLPEIGKSCPTGKLGICAAGTTQCVNGAVVCVQNQQPRAETCNGQDDNCNGVVDEGGDSLCPPGFLCRGALGCQRSCPNGARDGLETDVDCGGPACPPCGDNQFCQQNSDCESGACVAGRCCRPLGAYCAFGEDQCCSGLMCSFITGRCVTST